MAFELFLEFRPVKGETAEISCRMTTVRQFDIKESSENEEITQVEQSGMMLFTITNAGILCNGVGAVDANAFPRRGNFDFCESNSLSCMVISMVKPKDSPIHSIPMKGTWGGKN